MKKNTKKIPTTKVERPWGGYEVIEKKDDYWIKKLYVTKDERTSLQSHTHRDETWIVMKGTILAVHGDKESVIPTGGIVQIAQGEKHRIYGVTDAIVLEAAFGKPREGDITRYEDDYGRVS